jgi:hypothetical protein
VNATEEWIDARDLTRGPEARVAEPEEFALPGRSGRDLLRGLSADAMLRLDEVLVRRWERNSFSPTGVRGRSVDDAAAEQKRRDRARARERAREASADPGAAGGPERPGPEDLAPGLAYAGRGKRPLEEPKYSAIVAALRADSTEAYRSIAERLGVTRDYVTAVASAAGLRRATGRVGRVGSRKVDRDEVAAFCRDHPETSFREIAERFGIHQTTLSAIARGAGVSRTGSERPRRTVVDADAVAALVVSRPDLTYPDIAEVFGCSAERVKEIARSRGIRREGGRGFHARAKRERLERERADRRARVLELVAAGHAYRDVASWNGLRVLDVDAIVRGERALPPAARRIDWVPARDCSR